VVSIASFLDATGHAYSNAASKQSVMIASCVLAVTPKGPLVFHIPVDFILFGLTLLGAAVFHHHTLRVSLIGLGAIALIICALIITDL
jgi:hypothetical protein